MKKSRVMDGYIDKVQGARDKLDSFTHYIQVTFGASPFMISTILEDVGRIEKDLKFLFDEACRLYGEAKIEEEESQYRKTVHDEL